MKRNITFSAMIVALCITVTGCAGITDKRASLDFPLIGEMQTGSVESSTERQTVLPETPASLQSEPLNESVKVFGNGHYRGLEITAGCSDPSKVDIHIENTSSDGYSLGWVNGPVITCVTSAGEYYYTVGPAVIRAGGIADITGYFDDASGEIQYLAIDSVNMLTSRGLPSDIGGGDTVYITFLPDDLNPADGSETDGSDVAMPAVIKTGSTTLEGLEIYVKSQDSRSVTVEYKNNSSTEFSLGWVSGLTVTCTTTEGEYYFATNRAKIGAGGSLKENYYFDDASGEILFITLSGIHFLNNGLPSDFGDGEYVTIDMYENVCVLHRN